VAQGDVRIDPDPRGPADKAQKVAGFKFLLRFPASKTGDAQRRNERSRELFVSPVLFPWVTQAWSLRERQPSECPSNVSRHRSTLLPLSDMEEEQMNTGWTRVTMTAVLIAVILATSTGCEHQRSPTAPGPPTPAPSTPPSPVPTGNSVPAANNGEVGVYRSDVTMSRSGTATVALRWPNADFSLQLYVTTGACADITSLAAGGCAIVGRTRPGDLPGLVTNPVTGGDLNTIWVLNPDPFPQSFTVDVSIE